jgi:hypothetical protein
VAFYQKYQSKATSLASKFIDKGFSHTSPSISKGFSGKKGWELKFPDFQNLTRNKQTTINGRQYSGHALDQIQNRGIMPSVVEHTVTSGKTTLDPISHRLRYYDKANNVTVITEQETGKVLTVINGER